MSTHLNNDLIAFSNSILTLVFPFLAMSTEYDFSGKVVLVTGSSGGLGSTIAREFAKRGATLVITGRNNEAIQKVVGECNSLSPNSAEAFGYVADVTNKESLTCLVGSVIDKFSRLDVLVNNAGKFCQKFGVAYLGTN